jgi:predicted Zn-dependent peptidase
MRFEMRVMRRSFDLPLLVCFGFFLSWGGSHRVFAADWQRPQVERVFEQGEILRWMDPTLPLVDFTVTLQIGTQNDPEGKSGIAELVGYYFNTLQEDPKLRALGASRSVSVEDDTVSFSVHGLSADRETLLAGLFDTLTILKTKPLDFAALEQLKSTLLKRLDHLAESPVGPVSLLFRRLSAANTPYQRGEILSRKSIQHLTLEDFSRWCLAALSADRVWMTLSGDIGEKEFQVRATTRFREFGFTPKKKGMVSGASLQALSKKTKIPTATNSIPRVTLIEQPGGAQAHIRLGFRLPQSESLRIRAAGAWVNSWLAGTSQSQIQKPLREKLPVSYGLQAQLTENPGLLTWSVLTSTRNEMVGPLVRAILEALRDLSAQVSRQEFQIDEKTLSSVKKAFLGSYVASLGSTQTVISRWLGGEILGFGGASGFDAWVEAIDLLTVPEIQSYLKNSFFGSPLIVVIAGDTKKIQASLTEEKIHFSKPVNWRDLL